MSRRHIFGFKGNIFPANTVKSTHFLLVGWVVEKLRVFRNRFTVPDPGGTFSTVMLKSDI